MRHDVRRGLFNLCDSCSEPVDTGISKIARRGGGASRRKLSRFWFSTTRPDSLVRSRFHNDPADRYYGPRLHHKKIAIASRLENIFCFCMCRRQLKTCCLEHQSVSHAKDTMNPIPAKMRRWQRLFQNSDARKYSLVLRLRRSTGVCREPNVSCWNM